jgi:uncharacterized protein
MSKIIGKVAGILLVILVLVLFYGVLIEPYSVDWNEETALIPGLPAAWEGKKVAVISDFQVGMWMANTSTIRRIVLQLAEERPSAVFILGDFVYHPVKNLTSQVEKVSGLLRPLTDSVIPVYAVLGNHDYAMNSKTDTVQEQVAEQVKIALENQGIRVLVNEAVPLVLQEQNSQATAPGAIDFYLVGLGSHYPDLDRAEVALSQLPAGTHQIVIMHHPESFTQLLPDTAPLALAGHTHGGQIRIPFLPSWSWISLFEKDEVPVDGWIEDFGAPGNRLYVNRGIGFSLVPVRIACPPEVTYFTLSSK